MINDPEKAEYLKYLILWVSDWRKDTESLFDAMNRVPARAASWQPLPTSTVPVPPPPPEMSSSPEDYEWCDAYLRVIAYNNYVTALGVLHRNPDPERKDLAGSLGYDDVNSLAAPNEWMRLISGLFK